MVATRWPAFRSATAMCRAVVDLPEPPFSLPSTTTCAEPDWPWLACTSIAILNTPGEYLRVGRVCGQVKCVTGNTNRGAPTFIMNRRPVRVCDPAHNVATSYAALRGMLCRIRMRGVHGRRLLRLARRAPGRARRFQTPSSSDVTQPLDCPHGPHLATRRRQSSQAKGHDRAGPDHGSAP